MGSVGCDRGFLRSMDGIFKIAQFLLSLIVVICVSSTGFAIHNNMGALAYVEFTAAFACVTLIISGVIYFLKLYNLPLCTRLPWKKLEIIYAILCGVLYFIAMAISAAWVSRWPQRKDALIASAIFSAFAMAVFIVFAILIIRGLEIRPEKENTTTVNT